MRRTRHRRRFHTDRIVAARRARAAREWPDFAEWADPVRLAYGRLADRDPWDCGRSRCGICHASKIHDTGRNRQRADREWRDDYAAGW